MDESPDSVQNSTPRLVQELSREDSRELLTVNWMKAQPSLTAFLIASTPQFSDAEDLLQEVATEVARRFDEYDMNRPFLPWALWVAKIKIANFYRAQERRPVKFIGDSIDVLGEACERVQTTLSEEKWALEKCLTAMTGRSRELLQLRYFEDLTPQEISTRVNMSAGAVRVALLRTRSALIACIRSTIAGASGEISGEISSSHE
jgi:RNA polymerase sigma-70 factor (ECF subfamily)